jgi:hypothetical protein
LAITLTKKLERSPDEQAGLEEPPYVFAVNNRLENLVDSIKTPHYFLDETRFEQFQGPGEGEDEIEGG